MQDAVQTAVGGNALTQVLKGEARYDLTLRYLPKYRDTQEAIERIRLLSPSGERVSLAQLCKITVTDGASEVYREGNRRYVAIKYSVRGRDLVAASAATTAGVVLGGAMWTGDLLTGHKRMEVGAERRQRATRCRTTSYERAEVSRGRAVRGPRRSTGSRRIGRLWRSTITSGTSSSRLLNGIESLRRASPLRRPRAAADVSSIKSLQRLGPDSRSVRDPRQLALKATRIICWTPRRYA